MTERLPEVGSGPDPIETAINESRSETADFAASVFAQLGRIVLGREPLGAVVSRIAELAREAVPGAEEVSVTLIEAGRARTVGFAGELAAALDERQYSSGRGPCMDAAVTGATIAIEDTATDTLYPEFSRAADRQGMKHTLSVGMPGLHATAGALNIYGRGERGPFSELARDVAAGFASYAGIALANAAVYAGAVQEVAQMKEAMVSRAVIEQAKGIIMRDQKCDAVRAFAILRDASSRKNQKLRDVAQAIVTSVLDPAEPR
jgi:GAF domain-containing protein